MNLVLLERQPSATLKKYILEKWKIKVERNEYGNF